MTTYKSKGVPVPEPSDQNDPPAYIGALADWVNDRPGIQSFTTTQRNALTGADLWPGRVIFNTTTQQHEANASGQTGAGYWDAVGTVGAWQAVTPTLQDLGGSGNTARARSWGNSALYFQRRLVRGTWQVRGWVSLGTTCDLVLGGSNFQGLASIRFPDLPPNTIAVLPVIYHRRSSPLVHSFGTLVQHSPEAAQAIVEPGLPRAFDRLTRHTGDLIGFVTATDPWDWAAGDVIAIGSGWLA